MKKMMAIALVLMMVFCSAAYAETFKMGIDAEYPPYSYMDENGDYTGYDVEMATAVCGILGWDLEIVPINWDTKLIALDSGEIDCIWSGLTIDVLDPEAYSISMAYADNSQMILVKSGSGIESLADLAGKVVGVQLGTSADLLLQGDQAALAATFDGGERSLRELQRMFYRAGGRLDRRDCDRLSRCGGKDSAVWRRLQDAGRIDRFRRIRHLLPQRRCGDDAAGRRRVHEAG